MEEVKKDLYVQERERLKAEGVDEEKNRGKKERRWEEGKRG